jgi:hypothetical protein
MMKMLQSFIKMKDLGRSEFKLIELGKSDQPLPANLPSQLHVPPPSR